jgi:DNA-binding transcriptional LysR family regulator
VVRRERQGLLVRRDHHLAAGESARLADLGGETLLLHPREANPGHFDAVLELCSSNGVEPEVMLRNLSFDLAQTPIVAGEAIAIVGESTRTGLADGLTWLPLSPPATIDVALVVRADRRSAPIDRLVALAGKVSTELGW